MPSRLKRYQETNRDLHFITFSCYHRQPFLSSPSSRDRGLLATMEVTGHMASRSSMVCVASAGVRCGDAAWFAFHPNFGEAIGKFSSTAARRPFRFFSLLVVASAVAYVPLSLVVDPMYWSAFGPFYVQTSRVFHYFVYFLAGIAVGAFGLDRGLLAAGGELARRWSRWTGGAVAAFLFAIAVFGFAVSATTLHRLWTTYGGLAFVFSCAASSFAYMATFVHFTRLRSVVWDSLTRNAYGIYLVHYAFVS